MMFDGYIYVLQLEKGNKNRYYVGKTVNLGARMRDHYNKNHKSAIAIKNYDYQVVGLEQLFKIDSSKIEDSQFESITSKLETIIANSYIEKYGYNKVRGGKYLNEWDTSTFELSAYPEFIVSNYLENATETMKKVNDVINTYRAIPFNLLSINAFGFLD